MKIEKTFITDEMWLHYVITDNKCNCCRHNPKNYNPVMRCDGKCKDAHESVVECVNYRSINE